MNNTFRIEVISKVKDARAQIRKKQLCDADVLKLQNLQIGDVYTISKKFSQAQIRDISLSLTNPITQIYSVYPIDSDSGVLTGKFDWVLEVGFLPGVTDNIAHTAREIIEDLTRSEFKPDENVYYSQTTYIRGKLSYPGVLALAGKLYNPLIQNIRIKSFRQFTKDKGMDIYIPKVRLNIEPEVITSDLEVSDKELTKIGKEGIVGHDGLANGPLALDLRFMKAIQGYFRKLGRKPTDIELESLAQTWSEHCKHTIFADPVDDIKDGLFKTYIKSATQRVRRDRNKKDICVSVFTDNSGAISFDKNYIITHKIETHNTPSALDPFGGSITGIVGVNRDTIGFGLGAKPVANFYGFCLADPSVDKPLYKGAKNTQKMLSSRRIMEGVIDGVNAGGNQSGIPTPLGFIYFDDRYRGKPLVFVGTVGIIPKKIKGKKSHIKRAKSGDFIVMAGGRVGKDGIHGATFSSQALDTGSPVTAVQIGDPITQKKLSDTIIREARDLLLYDSITDNGAGGLSCSVAEMAKESGGCIVELDKVPLKYPGLEPWEIWISESQERMTLAVPPQKWKKLNSLFEKRGVEASVIGRFNASGKCVVKYRGDTIMDVEMEFLHNGLPKRQMVSQKIIRRKVDKHPPLPSDLSAVLYQMLKRPNLAGYSFISDQYDHIVQGNSVLGPLSGRGRVNSETSIIRPILNSPKGVLLSFGMYPSYSEINPYNMAACALDTAFRNIISAGGTPGKIALLDNFCWSNGSDPERLYELKEALKSCRHYAVDYGTPFISGKDSMFNDFLGYDMKGKPVTVSIPPTLLISALGIIDDAYKAVSIDAKYPGDCIYVLGDTFEEMGGSEYFRMLSEIRKEEYSSLFVPRVNSKVNLKLYRALSICTENDLVASAIPINRGGLGIALMKKLMSGMLGADIDLTKVPGKIRRDDFKIFSESQGRILVSINPNNRSDFERVMGGANIAQIGEITGSDCINIRGLYGKTVASIDLKKAVESYRSVFGSY